MFATAHRRLLRSRVYRIVRLFLRIGCVIAERGGQPNFSLERIGEQLVVMERPILSQTEVMNQPSVPGVRLALSLNG